MSVIDGIDPDELAAVLGVEPQVPKNAPTATGLLPASGTVLAAVERHRLPPWVAEIVAEPAVISTRSTCSFHLVTVLVELGASDEVIEELLELHDPTVEKYGLRDGTLSHDAGLAKARLRHAHLGKTCSEAGCENAPDWMQVGGQPTSPQKAATTSSWAPIDLAAVSRTGVPAPDLLRRSDGGHLLYPGKVHWFQGEPETGKTWIALHAVAEVVEAGERALFIDFEDDEHSFVSRLIELGVQPQDIYERCTYVRPSGPLPGDGTFDELLATGRFRLAVIDGVTEAFAAEGLDVLSNRDVATWLRLLPRQIADTGTAVVCVDHVVKDKQSRGRFAMGAQHKLAGIDGAAFSFSVEMPISRATGDTPTVGVIGLTVQKDRAGHVRGSSHGDCVAKAMIIASPGGGLTIELRPQDPSEANDPALCVRIAEWVSDHPRSAKRKIEEAVGGNSAAIRAALDWLVRERLIVFEKEGRSHLHTLTEAGRDYLDGRTHTSGSTTG